MKATSAQRFLIRSWALAVAVGFCARAENPERQFAATLHAIAPDILKEFAVPGAAVALIRNGEVVWMEGYGFATLASRKPVTPETAFNVGSISKTITAWGVLRLVEEGKIDLDRPVDTYLKRWRLPTSAFDNSGVTVRRLLSHTAGISLHDYHGWNPDLPVPGIDESLSGKTGTGEVRVVTAPGSGFSYSGAGYAILQLLIEDVTGQTLQSFIQTTVLQPLQMTGSQYGLPRGFAKVMATPYDLFGEPIPILQYNEFSAAGFTTNLRDLTTFASAGLKGPRGQPPGRGVLRPETLALMQSPAPASPTYGLGYTVRPDQFTGHVAAGHGGSNRGWESFFQIVPATGDGIVILTNGSNGTAVIASFLCSWRHWGVGSGVTVECPPIPIGAVLCGVYQAKGAKPAVARYMELRHSDSSHYDFAPSQLNSMGYELLRKGDMPGAIEIFRLNVEQFPGEWNGYDSLGEAYLKQGDRTRAIENYRKSLELNPQNGNGREMLKSLGAAER